MGALETLTTAMRGKHITIVLALATAVLIILAILRVRKFMRDNRETQ